MKKTIMVTMLLMFVVSIAYANDAYLELLRQDVRTEKVGLITEIMEFSDEESEVFWPIYREYELELAKLTDSRIALIKDYAKNYDSLSDEKADEIVNSALKLRAKRHDLVKKYYKKFKKALSAKRAAMFIQLEMQINTLIDLQIAAELPLIE